MLKAKVIYFSESLGRCEPPPPLATWNSNEQHAHRCHGNNGSASVVTRSRRFLGATCFCNREMRRRSYSPGSHCRKPRSHPRKFSPLPRKFPMTNAAWRSFLTCLTVSLPRMRFEASRRSVNIVPAESRSNFHGVWAAVPCCTHSGTLFSAVGRSTTYTLSLLSCLNCCYE